MIEMLEYLEIRIQASNHQHGITRSHNIVNRYQRGVRTSIVISISHTVVTTSIKE